MSCIENSANPRFAYRNNNSIIKKFNNLQEIIKGNIDVVMIAENKIGAIFTRELSPVFQIGYK